jgi:hypothetical protein
MNKYDLSIYSESKKNYYDFEYNLLSFHSLLIFAPL